MTSAYLLPFANHVWQSTLFGAAVGLVALMLRKNRAAVRHRLWLAASLKFLIPFSLLTVFGSYFRVQTASVATPQIPIVVSTISQPFTGLVVTSMDSTRMPPASWIPTALLVLWLSGFVAGMVWWFLIWRRVDRAVRRSTHLEDLGIHIPVMCCRDRLEPGVFGIFRPVLLLPEGITNQLSRTELQAVIDHELCHVRRRDNLTAAIHLFVEALFWFHPLVWWIKVRLIEEQERACDEEVLRQGGDPVAYAESILKICKFYLSSPLTCLSGITSSSLKKRIEGILKNHTGVALTYGRKLTLTMAGFLTIAGPIVVGVISDSRIIAQSQPIEGNGLAFAAASIKSNKSGAQGGSSRMQPGGRYSGTNVTLRRVVNAAYSPLLAFQIVGGPGWMDSDRFDIEAKADGNLPPDQVRLMLRTLLADRFKLRVHRETRELASYALVTARTDGRFGPKLSRSTVDCPAGGNNEALGATPPQRGQTPACAFIVGDGVLNGKGITMQGLAAELSLVGRVVLDRTALEGTFDVALEWSPDTGAARTPADGSSIFTALQEQLGLKLEAIRAPSEVLVIDSAQRPSEN